ncbi:glycosyltransferase family protein [Nocardia salmonicida]|uniref:glycosyltransferase n=1 Tax=Nocardia salmonicida TaxID=53431 RepID=UPI0007A4746D|nr:glycosyltransferase [Nocardia salmonicida]MBC7299468.1 glycosyltransferase [Nocardia sp.]
MNGIAVSAAHQTISVVTAAHRPDPQHLAAAYRSLVDQQLPPMWQWQWVIHGDADDLTSLPDVVRDDPRVSIGFSRRRGGPGVARTTALARAHGALIRTLDVDDMLVSDSLAAAIEILTVHPDVGWTTCPLLDLHPDGSHHAYDQEPPPGRSERRSLAASWSADPRAQRIHPSTLTLRRELVIALGGWMGLEVSEDQGLLLAADAVSPGYHLDRVGLIRRHHDQQMTRAPDFGADVAALRGLLAERAALLGAWTPGSPPPR